MADDTPTPGPVRRFVRRWARRFAVLAVLLAVLLYFAPAIAVRVGVVNVGVAKATAGLDGSVRVGGASLGWFSPVELRDITLADADGKTILTAPKVTSSKSLLRLAMSQSDLGTFTVENPTIEVVCAGGTTNLEKAVARLLDQPGGGGPSPRVAVNVTGADVTLIDADRNETHKIRCDELAAAVAPDGPTTIAVKATSGPGTLAADVSVGGGLTANVKANNFPLAAVGPAARRFEPGLAVAGALTADLTTTAGESVKVAGTVSVADLRITAARFGSETLSLAKLDLPCAVETTNGLVKVERAELNCDLGSASFAGTFDPSEPPAKWADRAGVTATADVDLAKLAAQFPKLLRLKEGTAIREGRVQAKLASAAGPNGTTWDGRITTTALRGTRDGQPLAWDQPIELAFAGRLAADGLPVLERATGKADFATLTASGSAKEFTALADVSLDQLAARLGQFIDLGGVQLAGTAQVAVANKPTPAGGAGVAGTVRLTNFALVDGTRNVREPSLTVEFAADTKYDGPVRIDAGRAKVTAGADALELTLLEPIADAKALASGKATAKLTGDLARWRSRADGFVAIPKSYVIGGNGTLTGTVRFDAERFYVDAATGDLADVRFHGAGVRADEPQLKLYPTDLVIDRKSGVVDSPKLVVASQTVGLAADKVKLAPMPDGSYGLSMTGSFNANLLRVQRTLKLQSDPALSDAIGGTVQGGQFTLDAAGTAYKFTATLPVDQFVVGSPQKPSWSEPKLTIAAAGEYDLASDSLTLSSAKAERPTGLAIEAAGKVGAASTTTDLDLNGKVTYDLAQLEPQLRNYLGQQAKVSGTGSREFKLAGRLFGGPGSTQLTLAGGLPPQQPSPLANLNGSAGLGWQTLRAYGFDVGQADLKANLDRGTLKVDPLEAAFGQTGKVRLSPTVRLDTPGYDMTLAPGKVIDRAKLTPAATADALGYALPAIARSTETEGTISFDVDDSRIPLLDPDRGTLKGKLTLHSVQVGPGPLVTEIATLFGAKQTKVTLANEQAVPVRLENGRVHHENLTLTANGFTLKTTGSVGLDGSLQLVADVPVPEGAVGPLLRNNPKLREAITAKRIGIPVGGTVSQPRLDRAAFEATVRKYVEEVAKDAAKGKLNDVMEKGRGELQKELEKRFDKFLPQPPKKKD